MWQPPPSRPLALPKSEDVTRPKRLAQFLDVSMLIAEIPLPDPFDYDKPLTSPTTSTTLVLHHRFRPNPPFDESLHGPDGRNGMSEKCFR